MTDELPSPGWDAIDAAANALYPGQTPRHDGYMPPRGFAGGALQGCSAYAAEHSWHYITYGLSELYIPGESDDPEWSGWGFELTMQVPRSGVGEAPGWPFTMLQEMAKHVTTNKVLLEPGHRIDLRAPVTGHPHVPDAPPTGLTVFAIAEDPLLATITTPNGKVVFLQLVGVTVADKERMLATSTADVLATLAVANPKLITDPARA